MTESNSKQLLEELAELASRYLDECLERAIRVAKNQLYEKLQHLSDNEQSDYSFAVNLLESNIEWIVSKISVIALKSLASSKPLPADSRQLEAESLEGLSLVSKDEFEDWLLVDVSKKKLERELGAQLLDVCQVFSKVKARDVNEGNLPIGPEQLLTNLKHAIDALKIPAVAQITIYRSATGSLCNDLGRMYGELISRAAQRGVKVTREAPKIGSNYVASKNLSERNNDESSSAAADQGPLGGGAEESGYQTEAQNRYSSLNTLARLGAVLQNGNRLGARAGSNATGEVAPQSGQQAIGANPAYEVSPLLSQLKNSNSKEIDSQSAGSGKSQRLGQAGIAGKQSSGIGSFSRRIRTN